MRSLRRKGGFADRRLQSRCRCRTRVLVSPLSRARLVHVDTNRVSRGGAYS
ncbi:hypothetical protein BURPS406E_D0742 [Burkholderia pseudomallei 406e]|uniref:Uncharacterized protein n=2 Tax=Burkholderia pseudomallei TaxID=28450 RepID=A0A0E1VQH7_BURPE|nr:hypothetical protein BURPS1106A_A2238 [Burkholderia pseudomallei 1106a]EDO88416.1 hypothetical protein BURPS406E_D0742 [Burkholderia pseudomallei 406e]EDO89643.1 hypothetical protein BURPSPAST_AC0675 [Burkholderia pseudomallei Pasteur 52237]EEH23965.1 conserved hypothetical protein [Burkholderia pseudomallei Pakistan 9]EES23081.1 hypothetical protein BURPS1106B_2941 [Burkholderia pseudomallei 1106b]EET03125.1 hypothetical protein BURPS1710A_A1503 [Burkholderia pseudomallei 1710a]